MSHANHFVGIVAEFIDQKFSWSLKTFGHHHNHKKIINHIRRELLEIDQHPQDPEEWVDVILLAMDGLSRICNMTGIQAAASIIAKHEKNQLRDWEPQTDDDHPIEHVREKSFNPKPPERLAALGLIYRERNAVYGDTYKNFGKVMKGFFPGPITIETEEEWNRMALFFHCADKLARYAGAFKQGGHVDSLDDNSVYSQMLQEYDAELKERKP